MLRRFAPTVICRSWTPSGGATQRRPSDSSPPMVTARIAWPSASRAARPMRRKWCKIDTFRGDAAFGSWLYRIVANSAYQKLRGRRSGRTELSLEQVLPLFDEQGRHVAFTADWSPRVEDPASQTELRQGVPAALDELPALSRTILVLR